MTLPRYATSSVVEVEQVEQVAQAREPSRGGAGAPPAS